MNTVSRKTSIDTSVFSRADPARIYLGRARSTLTRGGSVSCFVLHQQASCLEKELEMHHGFHRTSTRPWLPQSPAAALSKRGRCCSAPSFEGKPQLRLCVAARLAGSRRHAAPDRLEVRHGHLTSHCGSKFQTSYRISSAVVARRASCGRGTPASARHL